MVTKYHYFLWKCRWKKMLLQNWFQGGVFGKFCRYMLSIQERFLIKSWLWWRVYGRCFLALDSNAVGYKPWCTLLMVFCYQNCSDILWEKIVSSDWEKLLKFEAEGQEFENFLNFFFLTVGQNNLVTKYDCSTLCFAFTLGLLLLSL